MLIKHNVTQLVLLQQVAGVRCVAAPGTTTQGTYAPLIATGTTQGTATTTTASVLPARLQAGAECLTGLSGMPQASKGGHD